MCAPGVQGLLISFPEVNACDQMPMRADEYELGDLGQVKLQNLREVRWMVQWV